MCYAFSVVELKSCCMAWNSRQSYQKNIYSTLFSTVTTVGIEKLEGMFKKIAEVMKPCATDVCIQLSWEIFSEEQNKGMRTVFKQRSGEVSYSWC